MGSAPAKEPQDDAETNYGQSSDRPAGNHIKPTSLDERLIRGLRSASIRIAVEPINTQLLLLSFE